MISLIWQCPGGSGDIPCLLLGAGTSGGNEKPRGRALEKNGDVVPMLVPPCVVIQMWFESYTDGRMNLHLEFHLLSAKKINTDGRMHFCTNFNC